MPASTSPDTHKPILQLLRHYPAHSIRAALLQHWAQLNGIPPSRLERASAVVPFLQGTDSTDARGITKHISQRITSLSIKDLEATFETLLASSRRKSHGAIYTPNYIIDYLIDHGLRIAQYRKASHTQQTMPLICDPACGSAGFLIQAAEFLKPQITPEVAFSNCLIGFDSDPSAVEQARCLVQLYLLQHGSFVPDHHLRLHNRDTLLETTQTLCQLAGAPSGFDLIATNPPYVKLQNLPTAYRQQLLARYKDYAHGSFSLALLFLIAGHRMLNQRGGLAYITQNNLYTSLAGKAVRQHLQEKQCIRRIVDFGHHKVFGRASAYTCLIFLGKRPRKAFEYTSLKKPDAKTLRHLEFTHIPYSGLKPDKWRLAKRPHLENLNAIESTGTPLGTLTSIKVGFATLKDVVFLVHKKDDQYCVACPLSQDAHLVELPLTRPAAKVAALQGAEDLYNNTLRVIFPYEVVGGKYQPMSEERLKRSFPRAFSYLGHYRHLLGARDKGRKAYAAWYAWGRTQGMEAKGPKLLTKTFSKCPHFILDRSDQLFCNGYGIFLRKDSLFSAGLPIEVLERILNSTVMHYYAKLTSFQIEGNYQCYQKNFIERMGIPTMTDKQMQELMGLPPSEANQYVEEIYGLSRAEIESVCGPHT